MLSIPEIALQSVNNSIVKNEDINCSVFMVGSKSVGKSTLINDVLGITKKTEDTLVLEYSYSRKLNQKQGMDKSILHIWEYGGKLETLRNIISIIPVHNKLTFCVMIDLSKIKSMWKTLENCIQSFDYHKEVDHSRQIVILGAKYDLFKNYDSDIKKNICITLRSIALIYNADLFFYSHHEPRLAKLAKEMFLCIGSGNEVLFKEKITNSIKPLLIPKGADSWDSIGVPESTFEQIKSRHISRIASDIDQPSDTGITGPQKDYPEPMIDSIASIKYAEIRNLETTDLAINEYLNCLL